MKPYLAISATGPSWITTCSARICRATCVRGKYSRLNTVERVLPFRRIQTEVPVVRRHLKDWLDTLPKNPQRDAFLFETALNGRVLGAWAGKAIDASGGVALGDELFDSGGLAGGFGGGKAEGRGTASRFARDQKVRYFADGAATFNAPAAADAVDALPADSPALGLQASRRTQADGGANWAASR